jgi:urate oxidase / 2-oxo-4-hydroxy-4-carboxy-5-ureidoimidazoline decarboxylase
VVVRGEAFIDAYTHGDNRLVVATDTMKNFIHAASLRARARTLEMWLHEVGSAFLVSYPHMERIGLLGRELPFPAALVPAADDGFTTSDRLFSRERCDHATARIDLERETDGWDIRITDHASGRAGLQLIKLTGSAFADFARDEHTTLPERPDRPLYIWCDVGWRYVDVTDAIGEDAARYVAAEQVADLAAAVFHEFVSLSIQHLVNEIGTRMLDRWPQLAEVSFDAQNRLWDLVATSDADERVRTYCDPRPPYGHIGLVLRRE